MWWKQRTTARKQDLLADSHTRMKTLLLWCNPSKALIFFLSGFAFTDTDDSLESRVREGIMFYFSLPLPPDLKHSDIYFQIWLHVISRLLLDKIYHLGELLFNLMMLESYFLITWWFNSRFWDSNLTGKEVDLNSHQLSP